MANYDKENIDEPETVDIIDSDESEQENDFKSVVDDFQDEDFQDVQEIPDEDSDYDPMYDIMSETSVEARCVLLLDRVTLLKLNTTLLLSREGLYKQRLSTYEEENKELNLRLLASEKKVSKLEEELEINKTKTESRYSTLEKTYRELCKSLMAAQEANQKMRYTINELNMRNKVLEELVELKTESLSQLQDKIERLQVMPDTNRKLRLESMAEIKIVKLKRKLYATERQMNMVVSDLSKMISYKFNPKKLKDGNMDKYFDYHAMLEDYNEKCIKLNEFEHMASKTEYLPKMRILREKIKLLNKKLKIRSMLMMEKDEKMAEFYKAQEEDLKNIIKEKEQEKSWKSEEFEKVTDDNKSLKTELEVKDKTIKDLEEELEKTKAQVKDTIMENEELKKTINKQTENEKTLKEELQASMERENTHMAKMKSYMSEIDLKVKAMEVELKHSKEVATEAKRLQHDMALERQKELTRLREEGQQDQREQEQSENMDETFKKALLEELSTLKTAVTSLEKSKKDQQQSENMDETFKKALLEELSTLKTAVTSLEKSKKDQQQINNLILTLRHQNDTVLNTLREENRSTLNLLSEKNNATLFELREENSKIVATLTDKMNTMVESLSRREWELNDQINRQFETLKNELKSVQPEYGGRVETPRLGLGVETPRLGEGVQVPEYGLGLEVPRLGVGVETPRLGVGVETPRLGVGLEVPRLGLGAEVPGIGGDVQLFEYGEGVQVPEYGLGVEVPLLGEVTTESLFGDGFEVPGLEELEEEEGTWEGLEEKYKKLKALFRKTTASQVQKEKILVESLKKTVMECHSYKKKLDLLTLPKEKEQDCTYQPLSEPRTSRLKLIENCWCSSKPNVHVRKRIAKWAVDCEKATLDFVRKQEVKRRQARKFSFLS
ncbi:uncharacterized protein TOT_040000475 [Theileria orientalis strain Shintoku]|uniref:Uncharacterized protein n=1 Tax=Theileria orientalis strain Shintoku TaxID=869250 RepID=J4DQA2_THEOR|nr:uncharacterized protein TOT_040000475 [Theileria orientalis strain Shintoku]BAM42099.1 uncharacterized protein TOT_040000475 [Theileria orientalis strain Shintoku]|eukprot:XP_009692400.1 uncharacterized protein TOT_040000475 [Theileria orientalis strain Shintoku]